MPSLLNQIERVPVDSLEYYPGNPRVGDVPLIAESLRVNQQYAPIVVQRSTRYVLAGNHTLKAATSLGWSEIDAVLLDVDDERARKIVLSSNRTADVGTYDDQALTDLLESLEGDYEGTGYDDQDLADLLADVQELPPALNDPDDVPEPPPAPFSQPGDLWQLGPHRLLCGDSTDMAAVEAMLDGDRCDCMWTDPPYGVEIVGGFHAIPASVRRAQGKLTIQNDGAADLPELLAGAFAVATAALKPGAPVYVAYPPGALSLTFRLAFDDAGWSFRQGLIWLKNTIVLGRSDYHYKHEPILYGFTAGGEGRRGRGGDTWFGDNAQTSVFEVPKPARNADHPTMKPTELVAMALRNSCPPGGLVYEPFGGSGTTLIAAHITGRIARVNELDPRYVDVICRRFQETTGTLPILASTGEPHDFTAEVANQ